MKEPYQRIADSFGAQGLMVTLGARLALVADGEVHIELPYSAALSQQHGYLHAGATTSIVDSACGYAALTRAQPGYEVVSVEFKVNFMRPALGRRFLAVGRVVTAGKLLTVCTGEVRAFADAANGTDGGDESEPGAPDAYKVVALMQATIISIAAE